MLRSVERESCMAAGTSRTSERMSTDIGAVDGDVGARADGDAHVCAGKRRGVVDAVADHGHACPAAERRRISRSLSCGEHAGYHLICADQALDSLRRAFVVAREHDGAQAHGAQLLKRGGA